MAKQQSPIPILFAIVCAGLAFLSSWGVLLIAAGLGMARPRRSVPPSDMPEADEPLSMTGLYAIGLMSSGSVMSAHDPLQILSRLWTTGLETLQTHLPVRCVLLGLGFGLNVLLGLVYWIMLDWRSPMEPVRYAHVTAGLRMRVLRWTGLFIILQILFGATAQGKSDAVPSRNDLHLRAA